MSNVDPDALAAINALRTELVDLVGGNAAAINALGDRVTALEGGDIGLPVEPEPEPENPDQFPDAPYTVPAQAHTVTGHPGKDDVGPKVDTFDDVGYLKAREAGATLDGIAGNFARIYESNITIRNFHFIGNAGNNVHLFNMADGVHDIVLEDGILDFTQSPNINSGAYGGKNITVRRCLILGVGDGLKGMADSLYEDNYIAVHKPAGSDKHLDGIQCSGVSNVTIRRNTIIAHPEDGGNSAVFVQNYDGRNYHPVTGISVEDNLLDGGNFSAFCLRGHDGDPGSAESIAASDPVVVRHNTFGAHRYGAVTGKAQLTENVYLDGSPVTM